MGIMVKELAIFLRSANSTFAPSGWFMHAWSHIPSSLGPGRVVYSRAGHHQCPL